MFDHLDRRLKDISRAAVVYPQNNTPGSGKVLFKMKHDIRTCSPKTIDRLVIVPHDKQIVGRRGQHTEDVILQRIDILELIHHDPGKAFPPESKNVRAPDKQIVTIREHIVKIQLSPQPVGLDICPVHRLKQIIRAAD